ncbi:MAG: hypothetical protein WKG07_45080 [Hymenobacter sp.]
MNNPNQRGGGGYRQQQTSQSLPGTIKTKKYQFDPNTYTRIAMGEVWRKQWWYALIPLAVGVLPAIIWPSWWWLLLGVLLVVAFVLLRSSLISGVTQMEQSKPLFERMNYEADSRQLILRQSEQRAMALPWDQIGRVRREPGRLSAVPEAGRPTGRASRLAALDSHYVRRARISAFAPALV